MTTPDASRAALVARASQLLRTGPLSEAIAAHERLLTAFPDLPDSWYNLGFLQQRAGDFEAAMRSYREALDRGVAGPEEVHVNRAAVLAEHLERPDEAEAELLAALRTNPRYVPALINLGSLHEQRGAREPARQAYEAALAIDPKAPLALAGLANVQRVTGASDPLVARLRRAIADPAAGAGERADLGFALGKALDAAGAYDDAFEAYAAANRASRLGAGGGAVRYDRAAAERLVDRLIAAFPGPGPAVEAPPGRVTPIFVCGMFRSGSTLVEQILASHPRVTRGGEIALLPALAREYLDAAASNGARPIEEARLSAWRARYLDGLGKLFPGAAIVTDKRPDNFLHIGLILRLFPGARIIHTRRDPLDTCLSIWFTHVAHSNPYALDLADTAHWYRQYRRLMAHWRRTTGAGAIHDVDYDELVLSPRPVVERALDYCGLAWDDACLAFHETASVVRTPSAWQVREPLYRRSSGRWRNYERHLADLRSALADLPG